MKLPHSNGRSNVRMDPVVEAYKKDIDRTLLRENLTLTPEQRLEQLMRMHEFADELRRAGRVARERAR